jgi:hypothetical protein
VTHADEPDQIYDKDSAAHCRDECETLLGASTRGPLRHAGMVAQLFAPGGTDAIP